ncbi:prepilin peptidase [Micromonospora sp. NPDC051925]|uniref:prepilin peptidase n=1 Tax=Micromonospora sp. NPDC051925 TaxID=3364288 RepID=UPI0037CBD031
MRQAVILAAGILGAGAGTLIPRPTYRLSVPTDSPPRAVCHHCQLAFQPGVRGWVVVGNRCANCARNLGPAWPLLSGILTVTSTALAWRLDPTTTEALVLLAAWLLVASAGLLLACVDVVVRRLPTPIVLATAATLVGMASVAATVARQPWILVNSITAGGLLAGVYLLLALLGGGMGMGDVRLAGMLGLALGTTSWTAVLLGAILPYLLAAPRAVALGVAARGHSHLAFGPYLVSGAVFAVLAAG